MKNLKLFAFVIVIAFASLSFTTPDTTITKELRSQIVKLLGDTTDVFVDLKTEVHFTLNAKSEIVILSVDCADSRLESYVKRRLNYKKVNVTALNQGKIYRLPLKIKKE